MKEPFCEKASPKTLSFPTCTGCNYFQALPCDIPKKNKEYWHCHNPHVGCYTKKKFFEGLVAELQETLFRSKLTIEKLDKPLVKSTRLQIHALGYAHGTRVLCQKVLEALGE